MDRSREKEGIEMKKKQGKKKLTKAEKEIKRVEELVEGITLLLGKLGYEFPDEKETKK